MSGLPGYDRWLEAPYQERWSQEPPGWAEALLGVEVEVDGYRGVVEDWEPWEDADEDGRYGGVELVVRFEHGTRNMSREEVEECLL